MRQKDEAPAAGGAELKTSMRLRLYQGSIKALSRLYQGSIKVLLSLY